MEILYLDSWFALNLLCDYLLCLLTARAAGLRLRRRRFFLAALLGALYACAAFLPGLSALAKPGWKLLCGGAMGWIAFGAERRPLRVILLFFGVSAAFGGALTLLAGPEGGALRLSFRALLLSFSLCYGVGALLFRCRSVLGTPRSLRVRVELGGRSAEFCALPDSGNRLRDPVTGDGVLIASPRALSPLFPEGAASLFEGDPVLLMQQSREIPCLKGRMRLLRYAAVGCSGGLLPVFRPERLLVEGRARDDLLVAVSPQAGGDGFEAIIAWDQA